MTLLPRQIAAVATASVASVLLSGCAVLGTKGTLHASPSTAADLPFSNDGVYVPSGGLTPCWQRETAPDTTDLIGRVMAFTDDGAFAIGLSVEALTQPPRRRCREALDCAVDYGNYLVVDGIVEARAVGSGGDTNYRRIVSSYRLTPTGSESFYMEYRHTEPIFGDGERCHRQNYVLREDLTLWR